MKILSDVKKKAPAILSGVGPFLSSPRASVLRPRALAALIMGAILLLSFYSQARLILPIEKALFTSQVHAALDRAAGYATMRSAFISSPVDSLADILTPPRLETLLADWQRKLPDLLSVEILNERGESQAMLGDLPVGRALIETTGASAFSLKSLPVNGRFIIDDERSGCLSLICAHQGADGGRWFSRTRFSRGPFMQLFGLDSDYTSVIVPVMTAKSQDIGREAQNSIHVTAGVVSGPVRADALVKNTNVALQVSRPGTSIFRRPLLWFPVALFCACYVAFCAVAKRRNPTACASDAQVVDSGSVAEAGSPAHDGDPSPATSGRAESLTDYFDSASPPAPGGAESAQSCAWSNLTASCDAFPRVTRAEDSAGAYQDQCAHARTMVAEQARSLTAEDDYFAVSGAPLTLEEGQAHAPSAISVQAKGSSAEAAAVTRDEAAEASELPLWARDHCAAPCDTAAKQLMPPAKINSPTIADDPIDHVIVTAAGSPFHSQAIPEVLDVEWFEEIDEPTTAEGDDQYKQYVRLSSHFSF